jgi:hypothetical protein
MAEADEIAALEQILDTGAESVRTEGVAVKFNLAEIRRRLAAKRSLAARPPLGRLRLDTAWGSNDT